MKHAIKKAAAQKHERGFTLIETACALLVMMIGGLGICAVFAFAIRNNTGSRDRAASIAVAQQQMERYRQVTYLDAALTAGPATTTTVESAGRTYTVKTTIVDTTTSLKTITIEVTPLLSSDPWALQTVKISVQRSAFSLGPYSGGL
ncbi:MAG TPA: prepilin-type N-terminal cleavage/methylation domain-containing protein [Pyrinomonadaceae bacterium]|nr:prepilin-type N-terminal cleavage/methylation domain-containing protein [Pyrinomonadaceae bacterium]